MAPENNVLRKRCFHHIRDRKPEGTKAASGRQGWVRQEGLGLGCGASFPPTG